MNFLGGQDPLGRINAGKLRSLKGALRNSYQSASILRLADGETHQCLINPDRVKPDYDNKIISIQSEAGMRTGDTFYWGANNTYWLIILRELTETAYFRGFIRRCRHKLVIEGSDYYVYVQGPTETSIKWNQKGDLTWNRMNLSLTMYVTKTEDSLDFFKRFNTVLLDNKTWQIEATDSTSMEGIIQVSLGEYFNNPLENLQSPPPVFVPANPSDPHISGEVFVKPYDIQTYMAMNMTGETWSISNDKARILESDNDSVTVEVTSGKSGSFTLAYGAVTLNILIESL